MLNYALTVIGICLILFLGLGVFFYSIRMAVNPHDSQAIDPVPKNKE